MNEEPQQTEVSPWVQAASKKDEALTHARSLIERKPCTTDMQIQVLKDLILIEELRRDWGV